MSLKTSSKSKFIPINQSVRDQNPKMNMKTTLTGALLTMAILAGAEDSAHWKVTGYLDFYAIRAETPLPAGTLLTFRSYDTKNRGAALVAAQIAVSYDCPVSPLAFKASFIAGENVKVNNSTEPSSDRWIHNIDEIYASYNDPGQKFNLDFGKFDTWIGYESKVSGNNTNYSRGFLWTFAQPLYHAGARAQVKLGEKTDVGAFAVTGWNEFDDSNDQLSYGATVGTGAGNWGLRVTGFTGKQGNSAGAGGFGTNSVATMETDVDLIDVTGSLTVNDKTSLGVNFDFGQGEVDGTKSKFSGGALYGSHKLNEKVNLGLRAERFDDKDGIRTGLADLKLDSFTANVDWAVSENSWLRFEARHDKSNQDVFERHDGMSNKRTSYSVSYFVRMP